MYPSPSPAPSREPIGPNTIILPPERRGRLAEKYREYEIRSDRREIAAVLAGTKEDPGLDERYKRALIRHLLDHGRVNVDVVHEKILRAFRYIDEELFTNACRVVRAYCEGREEHLRRADA